MKLNIGLITAILGVLMLTIGCSNPMSSSVDDYIASGSNPGETLDDQEMVGADEAASGEDVSEVDDSGNSQQPSPDAETGSAANATGEVGGSGNSGPSNSAAERAADQAAAHASEQSVVTDSNAGEEKKEEASVVDADPATAATRDSEADSGTEEINDPNSIGEGNSAVGSEEDELPGQGRRQGNGNGRGNGNARDEAGSRGNGNAKGHEIGRGHEDGIGIGNDYWS